MRNYSLDRLLALASLLAAVSACHARSITRMPGDPSAPPSSLPATDASTPAPDATPITVDPGHPEQPPSADAAAVDWRPPDAGGPDRRPIDAGGPDRRAPGRDALPARDAMATVGDGAAPSGARIWGVTLDTIARLDATVESLANLSRRPTARVVFDENVQPSNYKAALGRIHPVAGVMGEILDSAYVSQVTVAQYRDRATAYLDGLGDLVDIWEIGNEINGEWLGTTADVAAKMTGAYDLAHGRGKATALTLYYNEGCYDKADHEMFRWAAANVPAAMKEALDYVLISYYEDDCNGLQPDWPTVFHQLAMMFPNAKIGFGECGTKFANRKADYVRRYYGLKISEPRYIGGYFWWYYSEDMVPRTQPLWTTLDQAIAAQAP